MADFELLLPGLTPDEVRFAAAHGASDPDRVVDVTVDDGEIRAKVLVPRSTQPQLRGRLTGVPDGTLVQGQLRYAVPLLYVLAYGAMFVGAGVFAAILASRGEGAASALVGVAAVVLLVITWLSLHAGVTHKDDDVAWLQRELGAYLGAQLS